MSKTKRPLDASVEAPAATLESSDAAEPSKKRPKSEKSMERKKKTNEIDKDRHHTSTGEPQNKITATEQAEDWAATASASSSDNALPEFHISVFGDVASSDGSKRFKAAETLVRELEEVQKAYGGLGRKDDEMDDCAPSVRYAVRRLIRGVSSSREFARQGFALGLTLLVGAVPSIRVDSVTKLTNSLLEVSSSMKGQEARDDKSTPHIKEFTVNLLPIQPRRDICRSRLSMFFWT